MVGGVIDDMDQHILNNVLKRLTLGIKSFYFLTQILGLKVREILFPFFMELIELLPAFRQAIGGIGVRKTGKVLFHKPGQPDIQGEENMPEYLDGFLRRLGHLREDFDELIARPIIKFEVFPELFDQGFPPRRLCYLF
jgi:hypothetical protein